MRFIDGKRIETATLKGVKYYLVFSTDKKGRTVITPMKEEDYKNVYKRQED